MAGCEFCDELRGDPSARFPRLYGPNVNRVVAETKHFVALPTIGQIFEGSLLVLPREHIELFSMVPRQWRPELLAFLSSLEDRLSQLGPCVIFEHGSRKALAGSCGIYHAHLHVVPLPMEVKLQVIFPEAQKASRSLPAALDALVDCGHYLLFGDTRRFIWSEVDQMQVSPQSQFFRRRLVEHFKRNVDWNWRLSLKKEQALLATIRRFETADAI